MGPTDDAAASAPATTGPVPEVTDGATVESPAPTAPTMSETSAGTTPGEAATPTEDTGMTTSPQPVPEVIAEAHDGYSFLLGVGAEVPLQLDSAWFWDQPVVDGDAVELIPVDHFTDPGFMEWTVTGVRRGVAVVSANGEPNCDDESRCPPTAVRLTFHVTD